MIANPLHDEEGTVSSQRTEMTEIPVFDDFALFTSMKRKGDEVSEDHSSKRSKTEDEE